MRSAGAAIEGGQTGGQIAGAGEGVDLPRVAHNDAVEGGDEAKQPQPHQHMQPAAAVAHDRLHRLGQRIVNIGQRAPVADAAGEDHHPNRQHRQRQNAAAQGAGNGALRIFGLFGGHGSPLNGEEEPDSERNGGEHPRQRQAAKAFRARPAVSGEMAPGEAGGDYAHKHQQLEDGQQGDDQLEGGGDADAEDIERHKDHVGAAGDPFRIQRRKLHVEVGADGHGDGRRGEDEFNQSGKTGDKAAGGPEGAVGIGERAASVRDGGGQLGKAENKGAVHGGDREGDDHKPHRARLRPAVAPAEVLPGYHQSDGDPP
ncbi:hypothetical protein SB00610_02849 [Klebsiella quasipneumoniae subsp. similipneumoniae]|nr:hypothetical protein SB00610_02849 [Klebsiella quasipneumoniae subsp. similipneumoniae]